MREIKFRKWSKETNRYLPDDNGFYWLKANKSIEFINKTDVVEQYTGMVDSNGVEIYEGDIVEVVSQYWGQLGNRYEVKFERGSFTVKYGSLAEIRPSILVIGNIHEDKELLGEQE